MSDVQWNTIAPQLPKPAKTGRPRNNDRNIINGILFILTTGCRWADMPDKYGSKSTAHLRFQELQQKGIWKKILSKLIKLAHKQGKTRFVVERFFAWLKCGFHRTTIRYERNCDNYIGFVYLASILMYWRVLG